MRCSRAWPLVTIALFGCGKEIVLGDSESRLPSMPAAAGTGNVSSAGAGGSTGRAGSGQGGMLGGAGMSGSAGLGGSAGMPSDVVPEPGEVVWSADHETGDISQWEEGGDFAGGTYEWDSGSLDVSPGSGRNGSQGLVTTIDTHFNDSPSHGVRVYRHIEDGPAYYSVWMKLGEHHSVTEWWSIFLFHARDDVTSLDNDVSLWDVRVVEDRDGEMTLQFYDHDTAKGTIDDVAGRVQAGQWFELTAYVDYRPPSQTRVRILLDGALLFDMKALQTARHDNLFWAVGNGSDELDPSESTNYLDDAAVRRAATAP
jgi:hypothetical protein